MATELAPDLLTRDVLTKEEVGQIVVRDRHPDQILDDLAVLIARRFAVDVCSIYLLEPDRAHLVLAATLGLRPDSVGKLRMKISEGLAGLVAERLMPVAVENAAKHPRFKFFSEAGEERYASFAGVPLIDRGMLQGVMVLQTTQPRIFGEAEMQALTDAATVIGPVVSDARNIEHFIAPAQERLWAIARNLWWSWNADGVALFRDLDPVRWRELAHNPLALLSEISLQDLEKRAGQLVLHSRINHIYHSLQEYLSSRETWGAIHAGTLSSRPVAYFSAEFGLHESIPIYSGGLGVLAGDHVKSASDLGVHLIAVGLFYDQGYFHQSLDQHGWQQEHYADTPTSSLPLQPAMTPAGEPLVVQIETRGSTIRARVLEAMIGRCKLLLLDSDIEGNAPEDRDLTSRLYGGDTRTRIRQELLLGIGGVRALHAMGVSPGVLHLNEGHSAFAALEMIRFRMHQDGLNFPEAVREVARQTVFTTHTPVPAGHDRFPADLMEEHLGPLREQMGQSHEGLMSLGRVYSDNPHEPFCMTVLALKLSRHANAVSSLHGHVSRSMWSCMWPDRSEDKVPIGHITNGVHVLSWLAPQMRSLYDRTLETGWSRRIGDPATWQRAATIKDAELWETHLTLKARLLSFVRRRAVAQAARRGEAPEQLQRLERILSPDALTIGFARRFATYKRANLFLQDIDRLKALVNDAQRPIQFVFAGKAHPRDEPGKRVLQQIAQLARDPAFADKLIFVEDYDMDVGRHFVQGVDVWLNNPRRPLEASGTSGQKVVLNGGLNFSILDGWWAEAYDGTNGFAIGNGRTHVDDGVQDRRDADSFYQTLSEQIIPLYYQRDAQGLPRGWIERMKRAILTLGWRFSSDRMVMDYVLNCYLPAAGSRSCKMS